MDKLKVPKRGYNYSLRHYRRLAKHRTQALSALLSPSSNEDIINSGREANESSHNEQFDNTNNEVTSDISNEVTSCFSNEVSLPDNEEATPIISRLIVKETCDPSLSEQLVSWALSENITHKALNKLLKILKSDFFVSDLKKLPNDARTLLKTPGVTNVTPLGSGNYYYFGITHSINQICNKFQIKLFLNSYFHISVNIDGLPLYKSTGDSFWPILCLIKTIAGLEREVFCVALYQGSTKPEANEFLRDFVNETVDLVNNGILINSKRYEFKIVSLICDLPAKSYILGVKGHNGFFSCTKCLIEGDFHNNVVCFLEVNFTKRTDENFRTRQQPEHHINDSIIENIPKFDMINNVPIDYMHCVLLGIMKRMLCHKKFGLIFGKPPYKIRASDVTAINEKLFHFKKFIPYEFARKTRNLVESKRFKATEFRTLLLYTGLVAFKNNISNKLYNNFLCLSVATSILINPETSKDDNFIEYAHELFKSFNLNCIKLYGPDFVSHNVHNLLHISDCVKIYGALDNFSTFPFENYMSLIKRKLRKAALPLQQIIRRTKENSFNSFSVSTYSQSGMRFLVEHSSGPLILNSTSPQYKIMKINNLHINVSKFCDKFVLLVNQKVIEIKNFATLEEQYVFIGYEYKKIASLFKIPCDSSILGIHIVEKMSDLQMFPVTFIKTKVMILPYRNKFACFPILHNL